MKKMISPFSVFVFIVMSPVSCYALIPQQVIELKELCVSTKIIQMMIE